MFPASSPVHPSHIFSSLCFPHLLQFLLRWSPYYSTLHSLLHASLNKLRTNKYYSKDNINDNYCVFWHHPSWVMSKNTIIGLGLININELATHSTNKNTSDLYKVQINLRRVIDLELTWWRMTMVMRLKVPTTFRSGGRSTSLSYWIYTGLVILCRRCTYSWVVRASALQLKRFLQNWKDTVWAKIHCAPALQIIKPS
jgi:hypothetical protein